MNSFRKLIRAQILVIIIFILFKLSRASLLKIDAPEWFRIFLYSFPNLCEGIVGVWVLTGIGLFITQKINVSNLIVYVIAAILTSIYVITQELKIHNLGGRNIYDPNDIAFSIIGIIIGLVIVFRIKPKLDPPSTTS